MNQNPNGSWSLCWQLVQDKDGVIVFNELFPEMEEQEPDRSYIYICLFISSPKPSCYLDSKDIIGTNTEQHSVLERERERER